LELSQKPPYNPTQHAKSAASVRELTRRQAPKSNSKKTGDKPNHA
jgi:hypothetical protein